MKEYIGIDVGGTFIKFGIINAEGKLIYDSKTATQRDNPEYVLNDLVKVICKLKRKYGIYEVGISLPGIINKRNQLLTSGTIPDLYKYPIKNIIEEKTNTTIKLTNDANAIALAEKWVGAGRKCDNFVCLPLGTGVGGAIFIENKIISGSNGAAGEFGLTFMDQMDKKELITSSASFYCGTIMGLCRIYNTKLNRLAINEWETDVAKIILAAKSNQKEAIDSLNEFYQNLARLLMNVALSIDPEKILIGGGVSENTQIIEGIKNSFLHLSSSYSQTEKLELPEIIPCQLGNKAGMIGAIASFVN
ncbi:ROK family protein [Enterococcus faecium]|uniref:ROK family protein n=1 Tax=Enterococcus faecium TaxID=1352 RepID=UPI00280FDC35|nr:ROK family protein [Enterococcus faecium]MDQ8386189.1 ROK family protein [Enterococcus faecium]